MKTSIAEIPSRSRNLNSRWSPQDIPTLKSSYSICQRINFILEKLRKETWLPSSLRYDIRIISGRILKAHLESSLSFEKARELVEELATLAHSYEDLTLDSSTLCQIRTLDLEMNDRLGEYRRRGQQLVY